MGALGQSVRSDSGKLTNAAYNMMWGANNRVAMAKWSVGEYFDDFAPVAAVRLRAAALSFVSFVTGRRMLTLSALAAAVLVLVVVPTGAAPVRSGQTVHSGAPDVVLEQGAPESLDPAFPAGTLAADLLSYGGPAGDLYTAGAEGNATNAGDYVARQSYLAIDIPNEELTSPADFAAVGLFDESDGDAVFLRAYAVRPDISPSEAFKWLLSARDFSDDGFDGDYDITEILGSVAPVSDLHSGGNEIVIPESEAVLAAFSSYYSSDYDGAGQGSAGQSSASLMEESGAEPEGLENDMPFQAVSESNWSYIWPADGELTSKFGYRKSSVGSTNHKGIDIGGVYGSSIYAADAGEVIVSEWSNSYGYVVQIRHENGHVTLYCHCSSLLVKVGQTVEQGQTIARMGATGWASGTHLHFEIIIDGENVDPLLYLPET